MDARNLLADYVALCNRALAEGRDRPWYRQAIGASRALFGGARFRAIVYEREPQNTVAEHAIRFDARRMALELEPSMEGRFAFSWRVPLAYLEDVVRGRPEWYLEQPVRLDWKWLTHRLGARPGRVALAAAALSLGVYFLARLQFGRKRSLVTPAASKR